MAGRVRRQSPFDRCAGIGHRRPQTPAGRARVPVLPRFLSPHPGHHVAHPERGPHRLRPSGPQHPDPARSGRREARDRRHRRTAVRAERHRGGNRVPAGPRDRRPRPTGRIRRIRDEPADPAVRVRRAPLRAVRPAELVGLHRGRTQVGRIQEVPRHRHDPHPGGGAGGGNVRADRRIDPLPTDLRPGAGRRPPVACPGRPHQRTMDRPVGQPPDRTRRAVADGL